MRLALFAAAVILVCGGALRQAAAGDATPPALSPETKQKLQQALEQARDRLRPLATHPPTTREDLETARREVEAAARELQRQANEAGLTDEQIRELVRQKLEEYNVPTATPRASPPPDPLAAFKEAIGEYDGDLPRYNQSVSGAYRMAWNTTLITTNVTGEEETMTIHRLAGLRIGEDAAVPPEALEALQNLTRQVRLNNQEHDLVLQQENGELAGAIDPSRNRFLFAEERQIEIPNVGAASLILGAEGQVAVPGSATRLEGTLTMKLRWSQDGQDREWFARLPFNGRKIAQ